MAADPRDSARLEARHGWLGAHQRPTVGDTSGVIRMGVRLYHPGLGRFLQVDPIEGGSANDYDYVKGDPVNAVDLDGRAPSSNSKGSLTFAEKRWCGMHPWRCAHLRKTQAQFHRRFGTSDDDRPNARKHTILAAWLALTYGHRDARGILKRHEIRQCGRRAGASEKMDCHNNALGLSWAKSMKRDGRSDSELWNFLDAEYTRKWGQGTCGSGAIRTGVPWAISC
jgi:RHS repeat-associated protein